MEQPGSQHETPLLTPQSIEGVISHIERGGEIAHLLAKMHQKIHLKDTISCDDQANTWEDWKRLGIFVVNHQPISVSLSDIFQQNEIELYADETVLELHLPPQDIQMADISDSLARLCEYLMANERGINFPRYIYGVSYLAKFAARYGFQVADLPQSLIQHTGAARLLENYADSENPHRRKIAQRFSTYDIQLCYIDTLEFMDHIKKSPAYQKLMLRRGAETVRTIISNFI